MELHPDISAHYSLGLEGGRLATWGRLEAERTRELLARLLPKPPAVILDVGGGEGAYALPLATEGYAVHLVDPVEDHVRAARLSSAAQPSSLASAEVGDARSLTVPDESVDAVLLLGPLYHLIEADDRARALSEAYRVLRPRGVLFAAGISRFSSTFDGLHSGAALDPTFETIIQGDLQDSVHRNPDPLGHPEWFTLAYFHTPESLQEEARRAGFDDASVYAVEGAGAWADLDAALDDPTSRSAVMRAIERVEREPSLLGASPHLMAIASKS
jgi:ubiquinone/menaquinone biosynthesis C-methylase UbiE